MTAQGAGRLLGVPPQCAGHGAALLLGRSAGNDNLRYP